MKAIIIGFGYVGTAIASTLAHHGFEVSATTRNLEKFKLIEELGYDAYHLEGNTLPNLQDFDVICLTVAADHPDEYELAYQQTATQIANQTLSFKHLIYTSSTSVYLENEGGIVHEESSLNATNYPTKILIQTEEILLSLQNEKRSVCVFRLGEIYGPEREISFKMKKAHFKWPGDGNRYTNMIHLDDICKAALFAIQQNLSGIYNLVDDDHFLRKDLFDLVSEKHELYFVEYTGSPVQRHGGNKRVSNLKLKERGFHWKHPLRVLC